MRSVLLRLKMPLLGFFAVFFITAQGGEQDVPCGEWVGISEPPVDEKSGNVVCPNITTGGESGSYRGVFGANFKSDLNNWLGVNLEVIGSRGSGHNILRIQKGKAAFGLAQRDVQFYFEHRFKGNILDPEEESGLGQAVAAQGRNRFYNVVNVAEFTDECVYVAFNWKKTTERVFDMRKKYSDPNQRPFINVGKKDSGSFYTWKLITTLNPKFGHVDRQKNEFWGMGIDVSDRDNENAFNDAVERLLDKESPLHAIMWVVDPNNFTYDNLETINANSDLDFMDFVDPLFLENLADGEIFKKDKQALIDSPSQLNDEQLNTFTRVVKEGELVVGDVKDFVARAKDQIMNQDIVSNNTQDTGYRSNISSKAYYIRSVPLKEGGTKRITTICTKAALYAHKAVKDPNIYLDLPNYTDDGVLWDEITRHSSDANAAIPASLLDERWAEIVKRRN